MNFILNQSDALNESLSSVVLFESAEKLSGLLSDRQLSYLNSQIDNKKNIIEISELDNKRFFIKVNEEESDFQTLENIRIQGFEVCNQIKAQKIAEIQISTSDSSAEAILSFAEGLLLSFYDFNKYKSDKENNSLTVTIVSDSITSKEIDELRNLIKSNHIARDFVNEPQSYLNAIQYAEDLNRFCNEFGINYTKFDKDKIVELGMGGLLAVNQGSSIPPVFNIMEYKPENAVNSKPMIFVGKGVVYDTGGLSLKPTPNSMDMMKCDMGGSAAVAGGIFAIAQNKLPVRVISIIAATDNWIGKDAYAPGDVITMYNGKTVEVLNTDAEGRLTLGDALTYADELNPELVIDLATLTGAAARAIGKQASVVMGNAPAEVMMMLQESGMKTHERLVEFPLYEEYKEDIKSDIADMKNLGGAEAGATTAGIFLENFTESPWIHIDIAGTAFLTAPDKYRGKNGTGVGVRLLYQFVKDYYNVG